MYALKKESFREPLRESEAYISHPVLQLVNTRELNRVQSYLERTASLARGSGKYVMYQNIQGRLKHQPLYQFIHKGLPHLLSGLQNILKVKEYDPRLRALQRLEAITRLLTEDGMLNFSDITPQMLTAKLAEIQENVQYYH